MASAAAIKSGSGRVQPALTAVVRPLSAAFDAAAWDALAERAAEPNPFYERWFLEASRGLPGADAVRVIEIRDGAALVAALPVVPAARYGRLPVPHSENWQHFHAFAGAPLLATGCEVAAAGALVDAVDGLPGRGRLLHLTGIAEDGPAHRAIAAAAAARGRRCDVVHRIERAMLASGLSATAYYEYAVRKKKRKELKRLENRLAELGVVAFERMAPGADIGAWAADYLALEAAGWKGEGGSALADDPATAGFFTAAVTRAHQAGRLDAIRMTLDGRPIAMLFTFLSGAGGFAFKTAFDESLARFSPGVLLQIANLSLLKRDGLEFVDSCAVADHSMINGIWRERRAIVRLTISLSGPVSAATFAIARALERAAAARRKPPADPSPEPIDD